MRKNVAVVHLNRGDLPSIARMEVMVNKISSEMREYSGEIIEQSRDSRRRCYIFENGNKLFVTPFSVALNGLEVTHLFIDEEVVEMANGNSYIEEHIMPFMVSDNNLYDAGGSVMARIKTYGFNDKNDLETNYYHKQ